MFPRASFIAVTLLAVVPSVHGQSWEPLHGPYSGEVVSSLVTSDGTVFAGTALKGLFYRHPDLPFWSRVESGEFDGTQIRALVEYDGTIVAGTAANGVFRSNDGGASWQPFNIGLQSLSIYDFMASQDGRLYAGTAAGLYRYGDGGEWIQIRDLVQGLSIRTVTENASGHLFVGAFAAGVFRSTDHGVRWELVDNGLATTTIRSLTVGLSNELYLGTFGGVIVQKSVDNGESWTTASNGLESTGVWAVEVSPSGRLFAGSRGQGISFSDDGGESWHTTNAPRSTVSGFSFMADGGILAASQVGLLRSWDNGETWTVDGIPYSRVNQLVFDGTRLLAGTGLGGIHYSADLGLHWTQTNVNAERILSITRGHDGFLYGSSLEGGLYRSDDGATWTSLWQTPIHILYAVAADRRGFVYAGTESGIYRLDPQDPDQEWALLSHPDVRVWTIVIDSDGRLYSGTENEAIWRSSDGGETWIQIAADFAQIGESIYRIAVLPDGRVAMAPTLRGGVWISADGGVSWELTVGISDVVVSDMTLGPEGSLVAAGFVGQVFELDVGSPEWRTVGPRFNITPIRSIAAGLDGTVYVGTDPVGVYQLPQALVTDVDSDVTPQESALDLLLYPNPTTDHVRIEASVEQPGRIVLEIYDVTGRLVETRDLNLGVGRGRLQVNTSALVRGTYFVRITDTAGRSAQKPFVVVR